MDLIAAMRSTPGTRTFAELPVSREALARVLDAARFAPSGMNRQPWRVIVIVDEHQRERVGALFERTWDALVTERQAAGRMDPTTDVVRAGTDFAHRFGKVPAMLAVWADPNLIDVTDSGTQSPSLVAGGSVFPFVQNVLLACRAEGLATRPTTLLARVPDDLRDILGVPAHFALACVIAVGHPVRWPSRLTRRTTEEFATWNLYSGPPVASPQLPAPVTVSGGD